MCGACGGYSSSAHQRLVVCRLGVSPPVPWPFVVVVGASSVAMRSLHVCLRLSAGDDHPTPPAVAVVCNDDLVTNTHLRVRNVMGHMLERNTCA